MSTETGSDVIEQEVIVQNLTIDSQFTLFTNLIAFMCECGSVFVCSSMYGYSMCNALRTIRARTSSAQ